MGRRGTRLRWPAHVGHIDGEVTVRRISQPKPGWTIESALDQLRQGYRLARVSELSGFHTGELTARARAAHIDVS